MIVIIGILVSLVFSLLAGIHIYWGLGGKWGAEASVPVTLSNEKVLNPKSLDCFIVASGLLAFSGLVLIKAGIISMALPDWLTTYGLWVVILLFLVRAIGDFRYVGFFKKIKSTRFGQLDTKYYSPMCLTISLLLMMLELIP